MGKTDFKWLRIWLLGYHSVQARTSRNQTRVTEPPWYYGVCDFMTLGLATWGLELFCPQGWQQIVMPCKKSYPIIAWEIPHLKLLHQFCHILHNEHIFVSDSKLLILVRHVMVKMLSKISLYLLLIIHIAHNKVTLV